jgi:hypothetical protein
LATAHVHPKILIIMGIADVRESFLSGAGGHLDVRDVGLRYAEDGRQILQFTGWHRDGTPFAFVSAAFAGDPGTRAAEIARDLIAAHRGFSHMPTPAPIKALAQTLRDHLTEATRRADSVATKANQSVTNLHSILDNAERVVQDLDTAAADIQAALGINTNGGPPLGPGS